MTVNERVCRNVKALCKMNHVAIGDVETKLGKHHGFFSRRCNVSPDMMIENDFDFRKKSVGTISLSKQERRTKK